MTVWPQEHKDPDEDEKDVHSIRKGLQSIRVFC